jgi:hypothetical protein
LRYQDDDDQQQNHRRHPGDRISPIREYVDDDEHDNDDHNINNAAPAQSLPDQIAASALAGTIEVLRLAGGLTLTATGKVVAPPLHVTRTVLLPALWAASMDYFANRTPKRAKDWLRILSTSVHHVVSVLKDTEQGQVFRQRLLILGSDLLDCLSADTTRQVLIDGMASFVKFMEVLDTAEASAFFDQMTVWACRCTQVAAAGSTQQALHDTKALLCSGIALLADPASTTALAEVTAYLCHALEMEQALSDTNIGQKETVSDKSLRRQERDDYQRQTYRERTTLVTDPHASVEEVILSSLGGGHDDGSDYDRGVPECDESDALSTNDPGSTSYFSRNATTDHNDDVSSLRQQQIADDEEASFRQQYTTVEEEWHEQAQRNVDVAYLQAQIQARAQNRADAKEWIPCEAAEIPLSADRIDTGSTMELSDTAPQSTNIPTTIHREDATASPENESNPLAQFYSVLDRVMNEKRIEGIDRILEEYSASTEKILREGKVHKPADKCHHQQHSSANGDMVTETIRSRLAAIRADVNKGLSKADRDKLSRMENLIQKNSWMVYMGLTLLVFLILLWIILGFYGLYTILWPRISQVSRSAKDMVSPGSSSFLAHSSGSDPNEVVIRLVREVVHVDANGVVLDRNPDQSNISRERMEKIAICVSDSIADNRNN